MNWRVTCGVLLALLCWGCHRAPAVQFPSAQSAIERLREQTNCSRAVQGEAKMSFSGEGRRLNGQLLYLVQAPDHVRFDVFSSFGVTLSTLTSDGEVFGLYNLEDKTFFYGPARTCNVRRFTRVPAPASALVELLRGRPPMLKHDPSAARIQYRGGAFSSGRYVIELDGEHQAQQRVELGVHPEDWDKPLAEQRLRLLGVEVSQAGQSLYEVELSSHRAVQRASLEPSEDERSMGVTQLVPSGPACNAELPGRIEFYVPENNYELTFRNQQLAHNPPLSPGVFRQSIPGGVRARRSSCDDR